MIQQRLKGSEAKEAAKRKTAKHAREEWRVGEGSAKSKHEAATPRRRGRPGKREICNREKHGPWIYGRLPQRRRVLLITDTPTEPWNIIIDLLGERLRVVGFISASGPNFCSSLAAARSNGTTHGDRPHPARSPHSFRASFRYVNDCPCAAVYPNEERIGTKRNETRQISRNFGDPFVPREERLGYIYYWRLIAANHEIL